MSLPVHVPHTNRQYRHRSQSPAVVSSFKAPFLDVIVGRGKSLAGCRDGEVPVDLGNFLNTRYGTRIPRFQISYRRIAGHSKFVTAARDGFKESAQPLSGRPEAGWSVRV